MTIDRLADGYEPDFDLDSRVGRQGELFVLDIADGIRDGRVEAKTDERARATMNVYVEMQCLIRGEWKDSGIRTTKAEHWAVVIAERRIMVALPTTVMREMAERSIGQSRTRECKRGSHPTWGAVIPLYMLLTWPLSLMESV